MRDRPEKVALDFYNLEISLVRDPTGDSIGILEFGCEGLEYSWTVNEEKMLGGSRLPVDRTEGDAEFDGSVKLNRVWASFLYRKCKELKLGLSQLIMTVSVTAFKDRKVVYTDTLIGVRLVGGTYDASRGPEPLMVDHKLSIMNIYLDGIDVFGNTLG